MLVMTSSLLVIIYSSVCLVKVYKNRKILTNMTGMTVAMVLGMVSSLAMGLTAGIAFKNDLTLSTIIAMIFSLIVGVLAGKPISLLAMVEGIGAGVMGGMMGAMLGEMLPQNDFRRMLIFIDILFMISVWFIVHMIHMELKKDKKNEVRSPLSYPWMMITTVISAFLIFTLAQLETKPVENNHQVDEKLQHQHHG
jgi:hypothetical protein